MLKKILFLLAVLIPNFTFADDCLDYKLTPKIIIKSPVWTKSVVQPLQKMDVLHGNVNLEEVLFIFIHLILSTLEEGQNNHW